jgi:hypothetical protein
MFYTFLTGVITMGFPDNAIDFAELILLRIDDFLRIYCCCIIRLHASV